MNKIVNATLSRNRQEGKLEYCDGEERVNKVFNGQSTDHRLTDSVFTWKQQEEVVAEDPFSLRFPAGQTMNISQQDSLSLSLIFLSVFYCYTKKSYKNTSTLHSMKEFVNFGKKCSCITDRVCRFPSHSLSLTLYR